MNTDGIFFNQSFDKKRLKALIEWVFKTFGEKEALRVVEEFKTTGFRNATSAGISIGLHELTTPPEKASLVSKAQVRMNLTHQDFNGARITATERSQRVVDTWHRVSETLRKQVVEHFSTYDQLNPIYVMALSGARGNFSQVRQLVGMRGLMADPQGQIISFPIRSNLREGLTLTEYFISCSGARKGLVDTALRTADTGYLTRRLVDVSHHVVVKRVACGTHRGVVLKGLQSKNKLLLSLKDRLVGRVLAEQIDLDNDKSHSSIASFARQLKADNSWHLSNRLKAKSFEKILAKRDQEISPNLASLISLVRRQVLIRSPLTCAFNHELCQLCYGWSLSHGSLVSLGEAVGVIAAQSIGEPGTQLTMRTFHTGGVFSGDLLQEIRAPHSGKLSFSRAFQGLLVRTAHGEIAFLAKSPGEMVITATTTDQNALPGAARSTPAKIQQTRLPFQSLTMLFVRQGEQVESNQLLAEVSDLGEEGNQPVQSQQTIFAEISGRVLEIQGGSVKKQDLNQEENPETQTANQIKAERSGRLGVFQILSTRTGTVFHPGFANQLQPGLRVFCRKEEHEQHSKDRKQLRATPAAIAKLNCFSNKNLQSLCTQTRRTSLKEVLPALSPGLRQKAGHCLLAQAALKKHLLPPLRRSPFYKKKTYAGTSDKLMQCQPLLSKRNNKKHRDFKDFKHIDWSQDVVQGYNKSSLDLCVQNRNTPLSNMLSIPATLYKPKTVPLLAGQTTYTNRLQEATLINTQEVKVKHIPEQREALLAVRDSNSYPESRETALQSFCYDKNLNAIDTFLPNCLYLNTIAQDGDLVNEDYKKYAPLDGQI